jgi:hypothetical protein
MATYTNYCNLILPVKGESFFHTGFSDSMQTIDTKLFALNTFKNTANSLNGFLKCDGNGNITTGVLNLNNPVAGVGASTLQGINSTTYVDVTGSSVTYTPATGSTKVIYIYSCHIARQVSTEAENYGMIQFILDGNPVTGCIKDIGRSTSFLADIENFIFVLDSWTGAKTMKLQARIHATPQYLLFNKGYVFEGSVPSPINTYSHYFVFSI